MNGLALCSGVGGLELGLKLAVPTYQTICHVEREVYSAAVLAQRMEEGHIAPAPIWDDVSTFDGLPWRGLVDIVTAGYPCQPFSLAGKRLGVEDERHIWPDIARIIGESDPELIFLENVPGHIRKGLSLVRDELYALGYCVPPPVVASAAEMGAGHIRRRVFVLAYRNRGELREQPRGRCGESRPGEAFAISPDWWASEPGLERLVHGAPARLDLSLWVKEWKGRINAQVDSWPPELFQEVGKHTCSRIDRDRAIGNAVVPIVAAKAFKTLTEVTYGY